MKIIEFLNEPYVFWPCWVVGFIFGWMIQPWVKKKLFQNKEKEKEKDFTIEEKKAARSRKLRSLMEYSNLLYKHQNNLDAPEIKEFLKEFENDPDFMYKVGFLNREMLGNSCGTIP